MHTFAALLLWQAEENPELTLNYILIIAGLVLALFLCVICARRRTDERDDDMK